MTRGRTDDLTCQTCGGSFWRYNSSLRSRSGHYYCSRYCANRPRPSTRKLPNREFDCQHCGKHVSLPRGSGGGPQNVFRFCSGACWRDGRPADMKRSKNGRISDRRGYGIIRLSAEEAAKHTCRSRTTKYIFEHRQIAERVLGRCMKAGEDVHHINGCKSDNRNKNLLICSTSYHQYLHHAMAQRWMQERFGHDSI